MLLTSLFVGLTGLSACIASPSLDVREPASLLERGTHSSYLDTLSKTRRELFDYAMTGLDANFGPPFLFDSPRYTAWYAVGLLARNEGDDVAVASKIFRDVIKYQYSDPSQLWFGTFRNHPEAPDPGNVYAPKLYTSYDLNQGLFVCTSWIIVMEEFKHLLEPSLVELMQESMYNATVGDSYRVGGVNTDNLYPVYSNPWYMRVMATTYVGHMMGDANMTHWGNVWAAEAIAEFDKYNTLSEFNSGTYTGVTLYALSLWGYMPKNATIVTRAKDIIKETWSSVSSFYNPTLSSLGGPWDRAYGYNMQVYVGILGAQVTGLVGGIKDGTAAIPVPLVGSNHYGDGAIIPILSLVAKFHDPYVSDSAKAALTTLKKSSSYYAQAASPPFDNSSYPRNYTAWKEKGLSAGGIQIDASVVGGAAASPGQFVPASILWDSGVEGTGTTWLELYPTSSSISAVATSKNITITYPPSKAFPNNATTSNVMSILIGGIFGTNLKQDFLANGTGLLPGLKLTLSGNVVDGNRTLIYGQAELNDYYYYNLTYVIPEDLGGEVPTLVLGYEKI